MGDRWWAYLLGGERDRGRALLEQLQLLRPHEHLNAVTAAQLAVRVRDVPLDRRDAEAQLIGDLLIPEARCDETLNLDL